MPAYWQKGIVLEALPVICKLGFEKFHLHRIEAFVESENVISKKALVKFGFKHEGTMKDCEFKKNKFISLEIYAALNDLA